jgi:hypothetical protein
MQRITVVEGRRVGHAGGGASNQAQGGLHDVNNI